MASDCVLERLCGSQTDGPSGLFTPLNHAQQRKLDLLPLNKGSCSDSVRFLNPLIVFRVRSRAGSISEVGRSGKSPWRADSGHRSPGWSIHL
jgi:hypothetical protein